jgi:hypothetical protein
MVCDFLLRWPSLEALKRVRRETLLKFFRGHNSVRRGTLEQRLTAIKAAVPLTTDTAVLRSSTMMAKVLAAQMKATLWAIREFDRQIEELCAGHEIMNCSSLSQEPEMFTPHG